MIKFKVIDKMFLTSVNVCVGEFSELCKYTLSNFQIDMTEDACSDACFVGICSTDTRGGAYILWLEHKLMGLDEVGSLVHEISHLTTSICLSKDIDMASNLGEARCYMEDFWFQRIMEKLKKHPDITIKL